MIEARTEDNKLFKIFCMKDPDYVTRIMESWVKLDELEGAKTRRDFIDRSGKKDTKQFIYRQPFGIPFRNTNQVEDHNNRRLNLIYLERTQKTKFWPDSNFA